MAGLQLSGLASGLDWKTLVDQLMNLEHVPVDRLNSQKAVNTQKTSALSGLDTKLSALQDAATALSSAELFSRRTTSLTTAGSTWSARAAATTAAGNYSIAVTQLASTARRESPTDIAAGLSATDDVAGLTLATLPTATAVSAGTFSVNGHKVTVALTDSLEDVLSAIAAATDNEVTATYSTATDKVTLAGATGPVTLGAANDTSNFLSVFRLANNGTATVTSSGSLGSLKTVSPLASAGLRTAITAVDGSGNGTFSINGVSLSYNVNTDSLAGILSRINSSAAGVTASYDAAGDRVVLTNKTTGDIGLAVSESAGGLLGALGLGAGSTFVRGRNAEFTVNGGGTLTSMSNTLEAGAHGIAGLSVTVTTESTQTVQVAADTDSMRSRIDDFIAKFNDVQAYIDSKTAITSANGKVTTSVLSDNREIQSWQRTMRSLAFGSIAGLAGGISRLEHLGIDFSGAGNTLAVRDEARLTTALSDHAGDVAEFFQTTTTGFAAKFDKLVDSLSNLNGKQQERLTAANNDIDRQIDGMERRLAQQRELLTSSFIAMESAQSKIQSQSTALTNAFSSNKSS